MQKLHVFLVVFFVSTSLSLYGQDNPLKTKRTEVCFFVDEPPLVIIDTLHTNLNSFMLNEEFVEIVEVLDNATALAKYGEKGRNGVMIAKSKNKADFYRLSDVIETFNLTEKEKNLRVLVNRRLADEELFLIDKSLVLRVEKVRLNLALEQVSWSVDPEEEYLNIIVKRSSAR